MAEVGGVTVPQTMPGMPVICKQTTEFVRSLVGVVSIVRSPAFRKTREPGENSLFHASAMAGVASLLTLASGGDDKTR